MKVRRLGPLCVVATLALLLQPLGPAASGGSDKVVNIYHKEVETHPSQGDIRVIEGATAILSASEKGIFASISTKELVPGNAYTLWFVAINAPENCENSPCKGSDVLKLSEKTQSDVGYGDGLVAGPDGKGEFATFVPVGKLRQAWIGHGLQKPLSAEIHLVLHDHGPLLADKVSTMIGSYRGGCRDESLPEIVPATAKSDGAPGPNDCKLVQDVIFIQGDGQAAQVQ
ncbi:MAG: hypothetical protein R3245_02155 [Kiloniellales bacterium]|nr:hypothetical protein [Kiloniellales bacterium]